MLPFCNNDYQFYHIFQLFEKLTLKYDQIQQQLLLEKQQKTLHLPPLLPLLLLGLLRLFQVDPSCSSSDNSINSINIKKVDMV
jgi:hypothetical protein